MANGTYSISSPSGSTDFARDLPIPSSSKDLPDVTLNWCIKMFREAEGFLASQPGIAHIQQAMNEILSQPSTSPGAELSPNQLSKTRTNRLAKIANDNAAILTDTKPFWEYTAANRQFEQQAANYGKLSTAWYQLRNISLRMMSLIKYTMVGGSAYAYIIWNPDIDDIDFVPLETRQVLPIRPSSNESTQSCQGVGIKQWFPVNWFKDTFDVTVKPEADGAAGTDESISSPGAGGLMGYLRSASRLKRPEPPKYPVACLNTLYLTDNRINKTGKAQYMGDWQMPKLKMNEATGAPEWQPEQPVALNNWSYIVQPGEKLFPNKRKICWVERHILYDGPSNYWHGMFPVIKLTLDSWPWTWNGKGIIWDLIPLQHSLNGYLRVLDDHAAQVAQPALIADKNSVSKSTFNAINTRRPGAKYMHNQLAGKGIQVVPPPPLDAEIAKMRDWIIQEMSQIGGTFDPSQFMALGQAPSDDTIDKFIQTMSPANRMRSRIIEQFTCELAQMLAYNFTQFYSLGRRVTILGSGAITLEDFDYDPNNMIPAYTDSKDYNDKGEPTTEALLRGPAPLFQRTKEFLRKLTFKVSPGSYLNSARMEEKMIILQMFRMGIVDVFTLWETWDIPNTGTLPDGIRTIPQRLAYQAAIGIVPSLSSAGRPASGQEPPKAEVKGGEGGNPASPRPVVSES